MNTGLRQLPKAVRAVSKAQRLNVSTHARAFSSLHRLAAKSSTLDNPPQGNRPQVPGREPPHPPPKEESNLRANDEVATFLGTTKRVPEFNLADKVVLVSGAARGLGLTQAEALLEAGATGELYVHSSLQCNSLSSSTHYTETSET